MSSMTEDALAREKELKELVESLRATCSSVRDWSRQVREETGDRKSLLARQLDRAAQYLDQAARAVRSPRVEGDLGGASRPPALTGSTGVIPLSSIVSFLAEVDVSGVLRIYAAEESYVLQFERGDLVYAFGDNPPAGLRLGEVLVDMGAINRADLLRVLEQDWKPGETLGSLLVSKEYVEGRDLGAALKLQIQELGKRLFAHEVARFRFYPEERVVDHVDVRMNVMGLLLDSARLHDETRHASDVFEVDAA